MKELSELAWDVLRTFKQAYPVSWYETEKHMSKIITPQQMIEYMVEALNNAVKDYPEEEQEATKAKILDAFSAAMFKGPVGNSVIFPYRPTDLKGLKVRHACAICGRSGVTGYVCYHDHCPTKVSCS